jgi:hypothetical protein
MPARAPQHDGADPGPSASDTAQATSAGPRSPWLTVAITLLVIVTAAASWAIYMAVNRPLATSPDTEEMQALDARLTRIESEIRPIASAFTSEAASGTIDVASFRARVARVRDLVDSTNDLAASTPEALEIRDLILTGGAQIVNGMSEALDALVSNDATATTPAAAHIDEGLTNLQDARTHLDAAFGRIRPA